MPVVVNVLTTPYFYIMVTGMLIPMLIGIVFIIYQNLTIYKQQHIIMATFTDLQTATESLTTAATNISNAITAFTTAHTEDITATDADIIVTAINNAVTALNTAAASIPTT